MELIKVYSSRFPFEGYVVLTICPWVFIRKCYREVFTSRVERHETTHALQQIECLWLLFFIIYGVEYVVKFILCGFKHKRAYQSISLEQEAYEHEAEVYYNEVRRLYAWVKYVFTLK